MTLCTRLQVGPTALARLEISGIQFNLTSDPQTLQMDTPYSGKFYAGITNGSVLVSTNLAGGANEPASLIGATGNSTATINVSPQVLFSSPRVTQHLLLIRNAQCAWCCCR